jgi:septin family protein
MADTFTSQELKDYKQDIVEQAAAKKIFFFNSSDSLSDFVSGDELKRVKKRLLYNKTTGVCPPFAIVNPKFESCHKILQQCNCQHTHDKLGR